ncbi:hypothetical protein VNI00_017540 [Paramarasmius palmivorus]|uniref:CxC2-like cysteine cluster KDZ transposase-associated domain-containing protein n=1 Tax=Paramarasmius palmivorus TaxID=297713 RepID=A0AAW0B4S3_9AGAR
MNRRKKNNYAARTQSASTYKSVQQHRTYISKGDYIQQKDIKVSVSNRLTTTQPELAETNSADAFFYDSPVCSVPCPPELNRNEDPGNLKVKAKRYRDSDAPLLTWKEKHREQYLKNHLESEGRGRLHNGLCSSCNAPNPTYRCLDCFGLRMYCKGCLLRIHHDQPLHHVQEWSQDTFFQSTSLRDLSLRIQLGHRSGHACDHREQGHKDFVIMHWNGLHYVNVDFCECSGSPDRVSQLMEIGWWPTSYKEPQSAATYEVLRNFHITNLQAHIPATDMYSSLEQMVDGTGLKKIPDRLQQFMDVVRQWRHIKMMKRSGRGHHPTGIAGTTPGEAAVVCRACPIEGVNIPSDWIKAPASEAWKYTLILTMDANFKQKARARPNDPNDPPLGPGFGCTVNHEEYLQEAVKHVKDSEEISHCVSFAAMHTANTRKSKGLRATGIGSVSCARHEILRPNGTGDLQKGERQFNMDWLFLSSIAFCVLLHIVISYDIACQWMIHFYSRITKLPKHLQMPLYRLLRFKVPKFHLPAHKDTCFARFAFHYTQGVGKVDGEAPERIWSVFNILAGSLSMMSAGGRWDTMDDHCNYCNWRKTVQLDTSLLKKLLRAITESVVYWRAFSAFNEALDIDHHDLIEQWKEQVIAWEKDNTKPCPYDLPNSAVTMAKTKKRLAEEDLEKERKGTASTASVTTMNGMVIEAMTIEEQQRSLSAKVASSKGTTHQQTDIQKRRTTLLRRIRKLREVQSAHTPSIRQYLETVDADVTVHPEDFPLLLPSDPCFDDSLRSTVFPSEVIDAEMELREAQACDALADLRNKLRARTVVAKYKKRKMCRSQGVYTRHRTLQDQISAKIRAARDTYNTARERLLRLKGQGEWTGVLRELHPEDIRGVNERIMADEEKAEFREAQIRAGADMKEIDDILDGVYGAPTVSLDPLKDRSDSARPAISWIWYTHSLRSTDPDLAKKEGASAEEIEASLRVEWCKARARACRAREELILVEEEMRRSIQFCTWKSRWWISQVGKCQDTTSWQAEGLKAYAIQQAYLEHQRGQAWTDRWQPVRARGQEVLQSLCETDNAVDKLSSLNKLVVDLDLDDEIDEVNVEDI